MKTFYERHVLPCLLHLSMRHARLRPYRERVISHARGIVLEIGVGSGLNLPLYGPDVPLVCAIDPSAELLSMAKEQTRGNQRTMLTRASAERLPFPNNIFDTIVSTWTLCTIPDATGALREVARVLKSAGQLVFVEHGLAPEIGVARCQDWLTPCWKRIGGGCHLNRKIDDLIRTAGFQIDELQTGYMQGPRPLTYMYEGLATAAH